MSVSATGAVAGMVWFIMRGRILHWSALALLVPVLGWATDASTNWLDIESRIQYGYYTEDLHSLRNLTDALAANPSHDGLKSYYQGLLEYRLTLLLQAQADRAAAAAGQAAPAPHRNDRSKNEPRQRIDRCVRDLDQALEAQSNFADALALQSACLGLQAEFSAWRAPLAAPKSVSEIHRALQWAPKNPRVLLLDAIGEYEHSRSSGNPAGGDAGQTCGKFKAVAAVFEQERTAVDKVPGWGAAEAYTWLGRCYLDTGEAVKARDALERALLIAPEFDQARRLIAAITSG
jgi:tetratricopeptide (TPR) repeat protein